jgi:hypothetical protein
MKTRLIAALLLLFRFTMPLAAAEDNVTADKKNPEITGIVKQVSTSVHMVIIDTTQQDSEQEKTISVEPETKITIQGRAGTLDDLKEGQGVKVICRAESSKAISIEAR